MKKKKFWISSLFVVILLSLVAFLYFGHFRTFRIQKNIGLGDASTEPLQTRSQLFDAFKTKYPDFLSMVDAPQAEEVNNADFFIVPGLAGAWSYDNQIKKMVLGKTWDPQGISASDDQIFISAYDSQLKLNSVIFVIDKKTGNYEKTIVLDGRYHVGSIAYDTAGENLWISTDTTTQARISMLTQAQLDKADIEKDKKPVAFTTSDTLQGVTHTSALNIADQQVFVGIFDPNNQAEIVAYRFKQTSTGTSLTDTGVKVGSVSAKIQGITARNDRLVVTSSYGNFPSKIEVYQANHQENKTMLNFIKTVTLPPYAEEVHFDGDRVLVLFESGASKYRQHANIVIDRVISLKASDFMAKK